MFVRLVYESFRRQKRRKLLAGAAITLGVTVATAMIAVATDIGDKINRELRTIGANLVVTPEEDSLDVEIGGVNLKPPTDGAFLNEADLPKILEIFWHNNITAFAPMLSANVKLQHGDQTIELAPLTGTYFAKKITYGNQSLTTGIHATFPTWKLDGSWPQDDSRDIVIDTALAEKLGLKPNDQLNISLFNSDAPARSVRVTGILSNDDEISGVWVPLALAQEILGEPGAVRRIVVSG